MTYSFQFVFGSLILAIFLGLMPVNGVQAANLAQPEVIASSNLVRFEVTPLSYDQNSNKYRYRFAWLMPPSRNYSFKIDGKDYMVNVTANGVVETPYWFSPDITYTIQIYSHSRGRSAFVAEGRFTGPAVAIKTSPSPEVTEEQEVEIIADYIFNAPELSKKTTTSGKKQIEQEIVQLLNDTEFIVNMQALYPYMTKESAEMLSQTPKIREMLSESGATENQIDERSFSFKVVAGKKHAYLSYKIKNPETQKYQRVRLYFAKTENGWKYDFVQMFKYEFEQQYGPLF